MQLLKIETTAHGCVSMAHELQEWLKCGNYLEMENNFEYSLTPY
jgi:hypothetical protein